MQCTLYIVHYLHDYFITRFSSINVNKYEFFMSEIQTYGHHAYSMELSLICIGFVFFNVFVAYGAYISNIGDVMVFSVIFNTIL
jgi:hypothetical protein